ncbi:MAG: alpha-amylase family glycosyl hydrolase [Candidatus Nanopelagicaceae bacterium]
MKWFLALLIGALVSIHPVVAVEGQAEGKKGDRIYFVMIDRFENGERLNDQGFLTGDRTLTGYDPTDIGFFHGGDLKGLTSRIDYIASLGFTAIWITPVARQVTVSPTGESAAYHGYWGAGFDQVDPHFGTMKEMKDFVALAHQAGLKVFLDVVVNHTGDVISYKDGQSYISLDQIPYRTSDGKKFNSVKLANSTDFPSLGELDTSLSFPKKILVNGDIEKSPGWLNDPRNYHNRGNSGGSGESSLYGDFYGLDDLFTESPEVLQGWVEVFSEWIKEVGIDGFRIDTFRHVNREFWLQFLPAMREVARESGKQYFPMWGEIYDSDPGRISEWVKSAGLTEVLDFPIQNSVTGYILDEEAAQLAAAFDNDDLYTTATSNASMNGTFLGNHDMGRIGGFIFNRFPDSKVALAKGEVAHALLYAIRGIPIVYYGDEFGLIGGRDKAARQTLFSTQIGEWQTQPRVGAMPIGTASYFDTKHPLQDVIRSLSQLRDKYPGLESGPQKIRYAKNATLAFSRFDQQSGKELVFLFNSGRSSSKVPISSLGRVNRGVGDFIIESGQAQISTSHVTLPPISWSLLTRDPQRQEGDPTIELLKPTRYKYDPSLLFLRALVKGDEFVEVDFQYRKSNGKWQSLGKDSSPTFDSTGRRSGDIYRVAPALSTLGDRKSIRFRAVLRDQSNSEVLSREVVLRLSK